MATFYSIQELISKLNSLGVQYKLISGETTGFQLLDKKTTIQLNSNEGYVFYCTQESFNAITQSVELRDKIQIIDNKDIVETDMSFVKSSNQDSIICIVKDSLHTTDNESNYSYKINIYTNDNFDTAVGILAGKRMRSGVRTSINVGDDTSNLKINEIINECFCKNYKGWQRGWYDINDEFAAWFPQITTDDIVLNGKPPKTKKYVNLLSDDGMEISEINFNSSPEEEVEDIKYDKKRLTFGKIDGKFRFLGVFERISFKGKEYLCHKYVQIQKSIDLRVFNFLDKQKECTEWFIAADPKKYNVTDAFRNLRKIDWQQNRNISEGDIVYIYVSDEIKSVRFKCQASKVDLKKQQIEDQEYNISGKYDGTYGRYMELEMIEELNGPAFSRLEMMKHGFRSPQGPERVKPETKEYLDLIQKLQHCKEMIPDKHDASYEIVRDTIRAYSHIDDLSILDYRDLNLVYLMAIGTWRQQIQAKKKTIAESHLLEEDKESLTALIDKAWENTLRKEYTNSDDSFGMFGTGFFTFQDKTDDASPKNFIKMCIDIMDLDDDNAIFNICEKVLNKNYHGMAAASASMVLHCLKPYTFPIFNSNMGNDNIFAYLGVDLEKKTEVSTYINNCRAVKKFRDNNFYFKNYRIFDIAARKLGHYNLEDEFFPTVEEYDPKIDKDTYYNLLKDENVVKKSRLDVLYRMFQMGGAASCKQIQNIYGNSTSHYNINARFIAQAIHKTTNCDIRTRDDGSPSYWPILFLGKDIKGNDQGVFLWKMREPLFEAVKLLAQEGVFEDMDKKIFYDKNMILYGPPGTGKTYNTAIYAVAICDGVEIESLTDYDYVMERYNELKNEGRIEFTTFHQSYGYEEFIEGIKPVMLEDNESVGYKVSDGIFKSFCEKAGLSSVAFDDAWKELVDVAKEQSGNYCFARRTNSIFNAKYEDDAFIVTWSGGTSNKLKKEAIRSLWETSKYSDRNTMQNGGNKRIFDASWAVIDELVEKFHMSNSHRDKLSYVFIIDEINRGNISKIFGELITLIENTKRKGMKEEASAVLPYSGKSFSVPQNVYIIGTMNTADRSIALMDTALRRRFDFIEMMPDSDVLRNIKADIVSVNGEELDVAKMLEIINERIEYLYDREHTIGHAFFTELVDGASIEKLASIFRKSVIPLLQEYFYEDYGKIQLVLGDNAKKNDEYKFILDSKLVAKDVFEGSVEELDLPEKKYIIQESAFEKIQSYKSISSKL